MPCRSDSAAPATMARTTPNHGSTSEPTLKPTRAPTNIMPGHAQVDDPGALGEELADGREEQHGAAGDAGSQGQLEVHRRTTRTR